MNDLTLIKQHTPFAQYQLVNVVFGETAHTDTDVRHNLRPQTPEHIAYMVVSQAQAGTIYHDMSGDRKPWRQGVITLRSSIPNARAMLLLFVTHEKPTLLDTSPAEVEGVVLDHEHDAADITSGTLDVARIPDLAASKITSGTIDLARISGLTDTEIAALAAIAWSKISKSGSSLADLATRSASDLSSGTLPDGRFPATLPAVSGANLTALAEANITDGALLARVGSDESITGKWSFPNRPRAAVYHSTTQSLANDTETAVAFDTEDFDVGTLHDTVTNNSRMTIPTGEGGLYLVITLVAFAANATGFRTVNFAVNGTVVGTNELDNALTASATTRVGKSALLTLAAGDYVEVIARQTSGGNLNIGSATRVNANEFQIVRLC